MARRRVKLNSREIAARLKDEDVRKEVRSIAEQIKDYVEAQNIGVGDRDGGRHEYPLPVKIDSQTTDRAREVVVLNHPAGQAVEAKHGVLVRGASAAGVEVRSKNR